MHIINNLTLTNVLLAIICAIITSCVGLWWIHMIQIGCTIAQITIAAIQWTSVLLIAHLSQTWTDRAKWVNKHALLQLLTKCLQKQAMLKYGTTPYHTITEHAVMSRVSWGLCAVATKWKNLFCLENYQIIHKTWTPGNTQYNDRMKHRNPASAMSQPIVQNAFSSQRFGIVWASVVNHEQKSMTGDRQLRNDGVWVLNWRPWVNYMGDRQ